MPLTVNIPKINITSEAEEDDDHIPLNISGTLTDVEDLYENDEDTSTLLNKRRNLKIKITDDSAVTDLEDYEASSDEEIKLIEHKKPLSNIDIAMEAAVCEENYNNKLTENRKQKLKEGDMDKTKSVFFNSEPKTSESGDEGIITDFEVYETDHELLEDIPDTHMNLKNFKAFDSVTDNMYYLPCFSSLEPSDNSRTLAKSVNLSTNNFLNIKGNDEKVTTDIEVLDSDSESDAQISKHKIRKKKHRSYRKLSITENEDLLLSDDEMGSLVFKRPKRKTKLLTIKSHSMPFDSENEENKCLPFPICQKVAKKSKMGLQIPEFDTNFLTEAEEIESEAELAENTEIKLVDEVALEEKLREIALSYGQIDESANQIMLKNTNQNFRQHNKNHNTFNNNASNVDNISKEYNIKKHLKNYSFNYGVKADFLNLKHSPIKQNVNLNLPTKTEDTLTDIEDISTPTDKPEVEIYAKVNTHDYFTDEEEYSCEDLDINKTIPEIVLEPATRNLILIQENASLVPTVRILPLDNFDAGNKIIKLNEHQTTDEENISEGEEALNLLVREQLNGSVTPELPTLDGGLVNVTENLNLKTSSLLPNDILTDTEDVILDGKIGKKRAPKFKYLHEKTFKVSSRNTPNKNYSPDETDIEDLLLSDNPNENIIVNNLNPVTCTDSAYTDTENFEFSDDENKQITLSMPVTPQHIKELGGETVILKEGSGPFSIIDKLELNKLGLGNSNEYVTPVTTDNEDMMVSAEEDAENSISRAATATPNCIHIEWDQMSVSKIKTEENKKIDLDSPNEVMYLKGGAYSDTYTDVEYFPEDELGRFDKATQFCYVTGDDKNNVNMNLENYSVFYQHKEWDATRKPTNNANEQLNNKDAAQQGDQEKEDTAAHREPTSSTQSESEESREKPREKEESSRKVVDQHQLSDEMKELLKEMEKDSKQ